jgi:hemoglobin-like flavoprotein
MSADVISESLNLLAERHGDPAPMIYRRLFQAHPELEALFVRDRSGQVRGHMLSMVLESMLDLDANPDFAANMIRAEVVNHQGLGVPPDLFVKFFPVVMETVRECAGSDWTPAYATAWASLLDRLAAISADAPG